MDVMHERVAGLDVHKETIIACVRIIVDGKATRECRTFLLPGADRIGQLQRLNVNCRHHP
jgi:hypothetical protein